MSGFRPANKKFDQLRKGPGTPRGASKNVLRPPPVRSVFTMLANSRHKSARQGRRAPGEASKTLGKALEGSSKASRNAFLGIFTHRSNAKIYVCYIYIYIYIYLFIYINIYTYSPQYSHQIIRVSIFWLTVLPPYCLTVLPSYRLNVLPSYRLAASHPYHFTILPS